MRSILGQHETRAHRLTLLGVALLLVAAALPRLYFLSDWQHNFDADEALLGVEAREILAGRFALFIPGQSYMGALQAAVAAPLLAVLGNHPNVLRLSPMLWILPGLLALLALERQGHSRLGHGRGAWLLALQWCFPPAVLFLAGIKARGGNLEGLVLGLWTMALLWPRSPDAIAGMDGSLPTGATGPLSSAAKGPTIRWGAGGLLFGLGVWTHDQVLLFAPLLLLCLALAHGGRALRALAFAAGFVLGYVPLWLPKLVPFGLGPPGTEGSEWNPVLSAPFSLEGLSRIPAAFAGAATTGVRQAGTQWLPWALYLGGIAACCLVALGPGLRRRRALLDSPALAVGLCLALANLAALLVSPGYLADPQWFRYTLYLTPWIVVSSAQALVRLPRRPGWGAAGLLALLSVNAAVHAVPGWAFPHSGMRPALVTHLEQKGIDRVQTDWQLAYVLRFLSRDRILSSSHEPPRFPEINAQVEFSPEAWRVAPRPLQTARDTPSVDDSIEGAFWIVLRQDPPSRERCAAFAGLDLSRTLFPHYEPFPLLKEGVFHRDWRGWPYRRPLSAFTAIVWQGESARLSSEMRGAVETALRNLEESGDFEVVSAWQTGKILRRRSAVWIPRADGMVAADQVWARP